MPEEEPKIDPETLEKLTQQLAQQMILDFVAQGEKEMEPKGMDFDPNMEKTDFICYLIGAFLIAILLTIFVRLWELVLVAWAAPILLVIGFWRAHVNVQHKYQCKFCGYRKCENKGKEMQLFFCDKWTLRPGLLSTYHLIAYFTGIATATVIFTRFFVIQGAFLLFLVPLWSVLIIKLILIWNSLGAAPHFYVGPPTHSRDCRCGGTGICRKCAGTGIEKVLVFPQNKYRINACKICKGYRICATELGKIFGSNIGFAIPGWAICIINMIGYGVAAAVLWMPYYIA